jgi:hypothetical protein
MVVFAAAVVTTGHFINDGTTPKGEAGVDLLLAGVVSTACDVIRWQLAALCAGA